MTLKHNPKIRNVAIIAHVDHGKTTLVDQLFQQSGLFRSNQIMQERVMDNMDLERERGITISAKNCSITFEGTKINIIDTPGHADFGGEVERALKMADGAILLVDAAEGPLPQTRFVLEKALESNLAMIVIINKIDRKEARPTEVLHEIYDLFIDLGATDEQINFPVLYAIGREGIAKNTLEEVGENLNPLFHTIIATVPPPTFDPKKSFQMLVCNLGYSDYTGRLAIGRVFNGRAQKKDELVCMQKDDKICPLKVTKLQVYEGIEIKEVESVDPGDIVVLSGVEDVHIGDTICPKENPQSLTRIVVDPPTVSMRFLPNTSPLAGKEGQFVQSARIKERLEKETLFNVAILLENDPSGEGFLVKGRGELQLAILVENMRREGFELAVGRPEVIYKKENGKILEPIEHLVIDCGDEFTGIVTEKLSQRKGRMINMKPFGAKRIRMEFLTPSRGLIGYRNIFLTDTKGTGIMNSYLEGYKEWCGPIQSRNTGSLVADRQGVTVAYGLFYLEERGRLLVTPGLPTYEGMIVGEHSKSNDLNVNACRPKKLSNMRATGKDEAVTLVPVVPLTLEQAIEFIKDDELVEVTPLSIRLRKTHLSPHVRKAREKGQSPM